MSDNTQRFSGRAEDYERYRQRYPAATVLERLHAWCGLTPQWTIADAGAGTGMLTQVFLQNGNRVIALEPNADMRHACDRLRSTWPKLSVLASTAEQTGLDTASVEMVAAGRAFHWFDHERAIPEFRRILKPGGWLALISVGRSRETPDATRRLQMQAFEQLLLQHSTDYTYVRSGYRVHENLRELFPQEAQFFEEQLHGTQRLDWDLFRGETLSLSVVPQEGHPKYESFQTALREFFNRFERRGSITLPTTCWITAVQLRS